MAAHILQIAYYQSLLEIRTRMLESGGYQVTSVLGNDRAFGLDAMAVATVDLIVIGFSASHPIRTKAVRWFKQHYPSIPLVVLRFYVSENFPEAGATLSEDPKIWLGAIASILKSSNP
jgi:hypothetical protein